MQGRHHRYEGYSMAEIALPVRALHQLGIELLILSNASGGVHPKWSLGEIVMIADHINLMWGHPFSESDLRALCEKGPEQPRWTSKNPYDPHWVAFGLQLARLNGIAAQAGVYAAVTGPNYETRAEYRMLRRIGADVVGMSTVPEALVAAHLGLPVFAMSIVTNVCCPDGARPTDGLSVIDVATSTEPNLRVIVNGAVQKLAALNGTN
jgi:purine-nucleoside phosphorylase